MPQQPQADQPDPERQAAIDNSTNFKTAIDRAVSGLSAAAESPLALPTEILLFQQWLGPLVQIQARADQMAGAAGGSGD